jgi:hypothetical protein
MWTRRQFLSRSALTALGVTGTALAFQGDGRRDAMPDGSQARDMVNGATETAVERGLNYLARAQAAEGYWGVGGYPANVAITSVGALALMAGGNMPGRGKYGENVSKALRWVIDQGARGGGRVGPFGMPHPAGFLHNPGPQFGQQGPMYSHGFGTLLLGEVCGMGGDPALRDRVHEALGKAVEIIVKGQNGEGGWRYNPQPIDADISVTVCQMMALRSAKNAGMKVPKSVADRCVAYIKRCFNAGDGSYNYQANRGGGWGGGFGGGFARTAAGVSALYSAGTYSGDYVERGLNYLVNHRLTHAGRQQADMHYFYGHYYAMQDMWTAGGQYWRDWFPLVRDELINHQERDGSWTDQICQHYATAMACIILQVPNNYLPIFQK